MSSSALKNLGLLFLALPYLMLCSCGGHTASTPASPPSYSVVANVSGLQGSGLALQLNGASNLSVTSNGASPFASPLQAGTNYTVTVATQPLNPGQICSISGGSGTVTGQVSVAVSCVFDISTRTTSVTLDSSVPAAVFPMVADVVSGAEHRPAGSPLLIPTNSQGFPTLVFAEDASGNILLTGFAQGSNTTLSLDTTAVGLSMLGLLPTLANTNVDLDKLGSLIQGSATYASLRQDVTAAWNAGTPPLNSAAVLSDIAAVMTQTLSSTLISTAAHNRPASAASAQVVSAIPPVPVKIVGPLPSTTVEAVYISNTSTTGTQLVNSMSIAWHASSADVSGNPIDSGHQLPGTSFLASRLSTPPSILVNGNGQTFIINLSQNADSRKANLLLVLSDFLSMGASLIGGNETLWNSCSQKVSASLAASTFDALQQLALTTPNRSAEAAVLIGTFSVSVKTAALQAVVSCATNAVSVPSALAGLASWAIPLSKGWDAITKGVAIAGGITDAALTLSYYADTESIQVCQSASGDLIACGNFWQGTYKVTSCSAGSGSPNGGPVDPCIEAINWPNSESNVGTISFRANTSEVNAFRRDYTAPGFGKVCKTDSVSVPTSAGQFTETTATYDNTGHFLPASATWTVSQASPSQVSGTFSSTFNLIVGTDSTGHYVLQSATVSGVWSASPLGKPFPKCDTPSAKDLYCTPNVGSASPSGSPCSQPFLDLTQPARAGEWAGIP